MCSVSNRRAILDKASCEAAATSLGLDDVTAYEVTASSYPPGCFNSASGSLYFRTAGSAGQCSSSYPCLCITAPDCTQTDGTTLNTGVCLCGGTACTDTTGLFCTASTSTCRHPACTAVDGSAANDASCACGTAECTSETGLFCTASTSTCSNGENLAVTSGSGCTISGNCFQSLNFPNDYGNTESCSVTVQSVLDGETLFSFAFDTELCCDELIVGDTTYAGTSGPSNVAVSVNDVITWSSDESDQKSGFQVCLVGACLQTDGSQANSDVCKCGTAACTAASGLFCTESTSTCSPHAPCTAVDGAAANDASCVCGTTDCTASNGLFCTALTNTCSQYPACSVTDGSGANDASCVCGTTDCTSVTGLVCTATTSTCSPYPACSDNDGSAANAESCVCGSVTCKNATGLICNAEKSQCGHECASLTTVDGGAHTCFVTSSVVGCSVALNMCDLVTIKHAYNARGTC